MRKKKGWGLRGGGGRGERERGVGGSGREGGRESVDWYCRFVKPEEVDLFSEERVG